WGRGDGDEAAVRSAQEELRKRIAGRKWPGGVLERSDEVAVVTLKSLPHGLGDEVTAVTSGRSLSVVGFDVQAPGLTRGKRLNQSSSQEFSPVANGVRGDTRRFRQELTREDQRWQRHGPRGGGLERGASPW